MKYVYNKHTNVIKCRYTLDQANDPVVGKRGGQEIVFRNETIDSFTGRQVFSGYTAVEDDVFEALQKDRLFAYAVKPEVAWMVVFDFLPEEAQTANDVMTGLRVENSALRAKIDELEALVSSSSADELKKARNQVEELQAKLLVYKNEAAEQVQTLNNEVGRLQEELTAAKSGG